MDLINYFKWLYIDFLASFCFISIKYAVILQTSLGDINCVEPCNLYTITELYIL